MFQKIVVSTEDDEIKTISQSLGADVIYRPAPLAENNIGTQDVTRNALEMLETYDIACCLYATAPLMSVEDLVMGRVLLDHSIAYTFSVGMEPLIDAGQFYWGWSKSFIESKPLIGTSTVMIPIESARVCDINTENDWIKAEQLYARL